MAGVSTTWRDRLHLEEVSRRAGVHQFAPASLCGANAAAGGLSVDGILELQSPLSAGRAGRSIQHCVLHRANCADFDGTSAGVAPRYEHRHALYHRVLFLSYSLLPDTPGRLLPAAD